MYKNIALIVLLSSLFLINNVVAHGTNSHKQEGPLFAQTNSDVGKIVKAFHLALKTNNKSQALALLAEDVTILEGEGVERSAKEYANHHLEADINFLSSVTSELIEHQVIIGEKLAVSSSRSEVSGIYDNKKINRISLETITLKKIKGEWKIIRIHWS